MAEETKLYAAPVGSPEAQTFVQERGFPGVTQQTVAATGAPSAAAQGARLAALVHRQAFEDLAKQ